MLVPALPIHTNGGNCKNHSSLLRLACRTLYAYRGVGAIQLAANEISPIRKKKLSYSSGTSDDVGSLTASSYKSARIAKTIFLPPCCGSLMVYLVEFEGSSM